MVQYCATPVSTPNYIIYKLFEFASCNIMLWDTIQLRPLLSWQIVLVVVTCLLHVDLTPSVLGLFTTWYNYFQHQHLLMYFFSMFSHSPQIFYFLVFSPLKRIVIKEYKIPHFLFKSRKFIYFCCFFHSNTKYIPRVIYIY